MLPHKAEQKLSLARCQRGGQLPFQLSADLLQFLQRHWIHGQAREFIFKSQRHVLVAREQKARVTPVRYDPLSSVG